ncbi:MAG: hypothetical protein P3A28_10005, partial [Gemmatimonadota bacterium]|nr:hypothetical protein [Gemmatimonadota bacterium]
MNTKTGDNGTLGDEGGRADSDPGLTRRELLTGAAGALGGALLAQVATADAQGGQAAKPAAAAPVVPEVPVDPTKAPGLPTSAQGARSPFVNLARTPTGDLAGTSYSPLQDLAGTIT